MIGHNKKYKQTLFKGFDGLVEKFIMHDVKTQFCLNLYIYIYTKCQNITTSIRIVPWIYKQRVNQTDLAKIHAPPSLSALSRSYT